ncbi:DUF202 domain-containing protein [Dethiosulfatarculus sandiegensis]|uniref:DUF202 domain-containing protein n=1 Tax=Dethiosulfatarculus sandiegensis TaxID=1429043 RepID=UPI0005C9B6F6|nr:DUF202 domain-containing protein [Dethiosulfatarculus sandiegensis]
MKTSEKNNSAFCESTIDEAKLLLAEKRTTLAMFRTAISMMGLPMGVLSFLIALSSHYQVSDVWGFLLPLLVFCAFLSSVGIYLMIRSVKRLKHQQRLLGDLKKQNPGLKRWLY